MIGDIERMPEFARTRLQKCMDDTSHCCGLTLNLALSYSSKWEILEGVKSIARRVKEGEINIDDIDDALFSSSLTTRNIPDPDLLIRTSGEMRVSNFLLWQIAYTELVVTDVLWPDFDRYEFLRALLQYQGRDRRFGGVK